MVTAFGREFFKTGESTYTYFASEVNDWLTVSGDDLELAPQYTGELAYSLWCAGTLARKATTLEVAVAVAGGLS